MLCIHADYRDTEAWGNLDTFGLSSNELNSTYENAKGSDAKGSDAKGSAVLDVMRTNPKGSLSPCQSLDLSRHVPCCLGSLEKIEDVD